MRQQQVPLDDEVSFDVHALYTCGGQWGGAYLGGGGGECIE